MYLVLLLIYITVSYAQLNSNDPEKIPGQYLSRKTQSHHLGPLDSVSFRTGIISKGGTYDQFNRIQKVIHDEKRDGDGDGEIIKIHDVTSGEINNDRSEIKKKHGKKYFGKKLKGQDDVIISSHPERSSRYNRELRQDSSGMNYNGLPVSPYVEPEKDSNGKVAYRNGNVSDDDAGELKFNSGEETTTEGIYLVNRMAFIGDNCPTGYARIFKKCVQTH